MKNRKKSAHFGIKFYLKKILKKLAAMGLLVVSFGAICLPAVTYLDVNDGDIKKAGAILNNVYE